MHVRSSSKCNVINIRKPSFPCSCVYRIRVSPPRHARHGTRRVSVLWREPVESPALVPESVPASGIKHGLISPPVNVRMAACPALSLGSTEILPVPPRGGIYIVVELAVELVRAHSISVVTPLALVSYSSSPPYLVLACLRVGCLRV